MNIIAWIVLGAIAGYLAGFLVKGDEGLGVIGHIVLGIVGALVGGFLAGAAVQQQPDRRAVRHSARSSSSVIGAIIVGRRRERGHGRSRTGAARSDPADRAERRPAPCPTERPPAPVGVPIPRAARSTHQEDPHVQDRRIHRRRRPRPEAYDQWTQFESSRGSWRASSRSASWTTRTSTGSPRSPAGARAWNARDHRAGARPAGRLDVDRRRPRTPASSTFHRLDEDRPG